MKLFINIIISILFTNIISLPTYSQNCACLPYDSINNVMDSLADIADYEKLKNEVKRLLAINKEGCKAYSYVYQAEIFIKNAQTDSANVVLDLAGNLFENISTPEGCKYKYYYECAELAFYNNNYEKALEYGLKMMSLASAEKNALKLAECNLRIANIFVKMSQPEKARNYAISAKNYINQLPESYKKYHLYNVLANRYNNMYQDFKNKKYLDTIEMFMGGIRAHAVKLGPYNRLLEQFYRKKAFLSLKIKDLDNSLKYLDSAHNIVRIFPIRGELYSINGDKANIYRKKKQYELAEKYADSCLKYALNENIVSTIINAYDIVYMVSRDAKNSDKALWAFENMTRINDSIIDVMNTGKIAELEQKYNKAQNEKTIRELNQESEIKNLRIRVLVIGVALTILLIIIIVFFYRQSLIKNRQRVLETEQRLNRSRINPHFFFNALTTLQGLAVNENDGKIVALNLFKFSSLMRQTLDSTYNDYVSIDTELEFLHKYIELQQLKEADKFILETCVNEGVETSDTLIPTMLIQPFIENSIEHGFGNINYKGIINLNFEVKGNYLLILITDNGIGLNNESQKSSKHISRAMQITKDRLYLLNKEKKSGASFNVTDNKPNGVRIEIILPLLYK